MGNIGDSYSDYGFWKFKPSKYFVTTGSTAVKSSDGILRGIMISAGTPTVKIWDNTSATATPLVETFQTTAATLYQFPDVRFTTGLFVTLTGATTATVFYK